MTATTVMPAATSMGPVSLIAADLDALTAFYARAIGLEVVERAGGTVRLGAGGSVLVELRGDAGAAPRPRGTTGLFHLALLVPGRDDLARAVHRVLDAGWGLTGAADHLVSEALYLDDPEGNGIEIYRDRPRDRWRRGPDGELAMATLPLDLEGVLAELPRGSADDGMPAGTTMGHVHLQVHDLDEAEAFWSGALGFDVVVRGYPGAIFVAAGGYHHHLGLNTWGTRGGAAPPAGARGLDRLRIDLPTPADVDAAAGRLAAAGWAPAATRDGVAAVDPSGNRLLIAA